MSYLNWLIFLNLEKKWKYGFNPTRCTTFAHWGNESIFFFFIKIKKFKMMINSLFQEKKMFVLTAIWTKYFKSFFLITYLILNYSYVSNEEKDDEK